MHLKQFLMNGQKVLLYAVKVEFMRLPNEKYIKYITLKSFLHLLHENVIMVLGLLCRAIFSL